MANFMSMSCLKFNLNLNNLKSALISDDHFCTKISNLYLQKNIIIFIIFPRYPLHKKIPLKFYRHLFSRGVKYTLKKFNIFIRKKL